MTESKSGLVGINREGVRPTAASLINSKNRISRTTTQYRSSNVRKLSKMMVAAVAVASVVACGSVSPGAGEEAVLIYKPVFFGHGGVDSTPIKTGRSWVAISTSHVTVNMQPKTYGIEFDDLMSKDGVPLSFHAMVRLQTTNSVGLISKFGENWFDNNVAPEFAAQVRNAVKSHGMNETAISTSAIAEIDSAVAGGMSAYLEKIGIPVRLLAITVGKANPPDAIKNQRIETATQEQRINTERQRKLAEDSRLAAEQSRASADNAYRNEMSLSPDQFLKLEEIKMKREVCAHATCTFLSGVGGVAVGTK